MKSERANRSSPAHLSIVGSSSHIDVDTEAMKKYIAKDGGVLAHFRDPKNFPDPDTLYGITKLMVAYVADELAKLARGQDNQYVFLLRPHPCCLVISPYL